MDNIFAELGKQDIGIDYLNSLHRDKECEIHDFYFRCQATTRNASMKLDSNHKIDLDFKLKIWGIIKNNRIVRISMENAVLDVDKLPEDMRMRELAERELKRSYFRMDIATRRLSRRMLPIEVKVWGDHSHIT